MVCEQSLCATIFFFFFSSYYCVYNFFFQEASFEGEKLSFTKYLKTFPFPYYIILRNIETLPRTLADLLRQVICLCCILSPLFGLLFGVVLILHDINSSKNQLGKLIVLHIVDSLTIILHWLFLQWFELMQNSME